VTDPIHALPDHADVRGARLAYQASGAGHPVVLVHAGIADARMWDDQVVAFAARYRVVRYDARGFGQSDAPAGAFARHEDLIGLLDALGIARAHLVGVSMGSSTARDAAIAYPDRVSALVLVSARAGGEPSAALRDGWTKVDELVEAGDLAGANELELRMWIYGPRRTPEQVDPAMRERVGEMNGALLAMDGEGMDEQELDPPAAGRLGEIRVPTLVVVGAEDVPDVVDSADPLVHAIPGAKRATIAGAAHLPNMEKPEEFNRIVLTFLDEIDIG